MERGKWFILASGFVNLPAPKKEGRQKSDGHGIGVRTSGVGGRRDTVFNNGVDLQLRMTERLGDMIAAARSENLRIPFVDHIMEICLRFQSKEYFIMSCTRSYAPVRG